MSDLASIAGKWVPDEAMHPATNIWNREWMTKDGEMHGKYLGQFSLPDEARRRGLLWHFPATSPPISGDAE